MPPLQGEVAMAEVKVIKDGNNFFVEVDGVRIAQRGFPNSPQAGTWVSLEPGWEVVDGEGQKIVAITYHGASVH
jgi:hypothetical protein